MVSRPFQSRQNLVRKKSSAAAMLMEEDGVLRPRLEALRLQLEKENEGGTSRVQLTSKRADDPQDAKLPITLSPDLEVLIKQLDALPMPQEPLTDKFGRQHSYLRVSLSEKCNLRCLYCMPEEGVPVQPQSHLLSNDEIMTLARQFVDQGVNKIRLTGGEPLLRKDIVDLVGRLNQLGLQQIGITTNGVTLSKLLPDLVDAGLTHVNVSLDSLDPEKFAKLTRRPPSYHARVIQAIEDCARYLPGRSKINCVVLPDNVAELHDFSKLTWRMPIDVRFIEYMPFNDNLWQTDGFVSYQQMKNQIPGLERLKDGSNDTTKWWTLPPGSGASSLGRIGFITSMSEHFCGTCNRLRLTADGKLKVCLFGKTEVSLRDLLRSGASNDTLLKLIHYSVQKKHFKLGGHKDMDDLKAHSNENRPMTLIGG
jgi:molybdenum cofactor biosynthesis protein A